MQLIWWEFEPLQLAKKYSEKEELKWKIFVLILCLLEMGIVIKTKTIKILYVVQLANLKNFQLKRFMIVRDKFQAVMVIENIL